MKHIPYVIIMLFGINYSYSQVGIGTTTPDDGSILQIDSTTGALVPPRMTSSEMNAIPTPLDGALVFNISRNSYYVFKNSTWSNLANSSLVINKDFGGSNNILATPDNTYVNFPIGPSEVIVTNPDVYNVTANGTITIKEKGNYLFSASLSTPNMPSGNKKYILAISINNSLKAYLSRGVATLPSSDYWGTSGNIMYPINANDVVKMQYVLNNGGTALDAKFINIGISRLN
ncbi:hypothetical protein SAMN05428642_10139 [Flaviramulus basaltis]|uniref:C1q domain-containing protein n=1 Tax=Flaviramulus basaltis TaxID=369401 RepID=A0A1K2I9Y4_9FLAO|nr:hypothetical protein [Flaviramulus basaltis]SFZ89207.1 hypothetical protein SAMN05428642_10139 [Flaviramulus basaltis]